MKRSRLLIIALLAAQSAAAQDARPVVAVLPFENGGSYGKDKEDFDALRKGLAATLTYEMARNPGVRLADRAATQRMVDEQGPAVAERVDAATAAKVGRQAGARFVVTGSFIDLYGDFRIDARLISTETGEVLKVVRSDPKLHDRRDMSRMVQSVAERLTAGTPLPPMPASITARLPVPVEALAFFSRALLYHDKGDKARAVEYYRKALDVLASYPEASEGLTRARAP